MKPSRFQDFTLTLSAGVPQYLHFGEASSITLITATSPVLIKFNNGSSSVTFSAGDGLDENDFSDIEISSAAAQTVVVRLSTGYQRTAQTVNVNASATIASANSNPALSDVTVGAGLKVLVAAANTNRRQLIIRSDDANTTSVRIGNTTTVGATSGIKVNPDDTLILDSSAAVYAFNPSASAVVLSATEVEKV